MDSLRSRVSTFRPGMCLISSLVIVFVFVFTMLLPAGSSADVPPVAAESCQPSGSVLTDVSLGCESNGGFTSARSRAPVAICVRKGPRLAYAKRPRKCDFLQLDAPIVHPAMILTHQMKWRRWHRRYAFGTGRHHINMGPSNGVPIQIKLTVPRKVCGHFVYTRLRARGRVNLRPPYGRWRKWGPVTKIEVCRR